MRSCYDRSPTLALATCVLAVWANTNVVAARGSTSVEPDEAQKSLSREVYAKYINQTIVGRFGTDDFYQLWLYGDGTFAEYANSGQPGPINAPSDVKWTGSSWWAAGQSAARQICLKPPGGSITCRELEPDRHPGDHWSQKDGEVVLLSGLIWTAPHKLSAAPVDNPAQYDPAAKRDAEPSEAAKAASRETYSSFIGNTVVCGFSGEGGCMLWLFANGTFLVHMPPGASPSPVETPIKERFGMSWWAAGTDADHKLCLHHGGQGGRRDFIVCYHLDPHHKPGDVWQEADYTIALLYGRN